MMLNRRVIKGSQEVKVPYRLFKDYQTAVRHIEVIMMTHDTAREPIIPSLERGERGNTLDARFDLDTLGVEVQFIGDQVLASWRSKVRADKEIKLHSTGVILLARFYMHEWYKAAFRHSTLGKWLDGMFIYYQIEETADEVVRLVFDSEAVLDLVLEFYQKDTPVVN